NKRYNIYATNIVMSGVRKRQLPPWSPSYSDITEAKLPVFARKLRFRVRWMRSVIKGGSLRFRTPGGKKGKNSRIADIVGARAGFNGTLVPSSEFFHVRIPEDLGDVPL